MDRRQLMSQMGTLAGLAVVSPSVSLAALFKEPSHVPNIVPNDEHDEISLFLGIDLLTHVIFRREHGGPLFEEILNARKRLASAGWNQPKIRIRDDIKLPTDSYVIHVYGMKVFTGTMLPDLAKRQYQERKEDDVVQERVIAAELEEIAVQHQYLWPLEERNERRQHCRPS